MLLAVPVPVPVPPESISNSFVRAGAVFPAADRAVRDADSTCIFTGGSLDTAAGRHESLATCQGSAYPPNVRSQPQTSSLRPQAQASSLKLQASSFKPQPSRSVTKTSPARDFLYKQRDSLPFVIRSAFFCALIVHVGASSITFTTIEGMPRDSRTKPCKGIGTCCYR